MQGHLSIFQFIGLLVVLNCVISVSVFVFFLNLGTVTAALMCLGAHVTF